MDGLANLSPLWLAAVALPFGLIVGSFLNVVIHRLPLGESVVSPGSHCPRCEAPVAPCDNVPVLSWLWLRGRCRTCREPISPRYPAIELLTGLLFAAIVASHGASPVTLVLLLFVAALVASAAIDFDHGIIPDEISIGGLVAALLIVPLAHTLSGMPAGSAVLRSVAGAVLGGGLLWTVGFAHTRVSVAMGRTFPHWPGEGEQNPKPGELDYWVWFPGLGFGDVKLLAMIGAVVGPFGVVRTIFFAAVAGLLLGVGYAAVTRHWNAPFGFGPAIAVGALIVVLAPDRWLPL
jgi:leader peptidase (prepilin peptidase)/N-methyltransferase